MNKQAINPNVKRIATESLAKITQGKPIDMTNIESTIDAFVVELIRNTLFEATDMLRHTARESDSKEAATALKLASIDILDHFGV